MELVELHASWCRHHGYQKKKVGEFLSTEDVCAIEGFEESRLELYVTLFVYGDAWCPCLLDLSSAILSMVTLS